VIAGTGPLLLAVAHHVATAGADVLLIAEQASSSQVSRFAFKAAFDLGRLRQLAEMSCSLEPRLLRLGWWVAEAMGSDHLQEVVVTNGTAHRRLSVDWLAVSYGLVPNTDVARLLNLDTCKSAIWVDQSLRTSNPDIWAAGECIGIGGSDKAIAEGEAAGRAACGQTVDLGPVQQHRTYAKALEAAYRIRPEVRALARQDTILCRCENVTFGELQTAKSAREAKLHTRCGMGACQGRVCGPIVEALWNWEQPFVRPPLIPIDVRSCISLGVAGCGDA
jgi:NAD(P)H-nitrite reductase large subunit